MACLLSHIRILIIQLARLNVHVVWWLLYTSHSLCYSTNIMMVLPRNLSLFLGIICKCLNKAPTNGDARVCVCVKRNASTRRGGESPGCFCFLFYLLTRLSSPTFGRKKLYNIHLGLTLWADCKLAAATILFSLSQMSNGFCKSRAWCWVAG